MATSIAVVGATGQVGQTLLKLLAGRKFPADRLILLASERSSGQTLPYLNHTLVIQSLSSFDFSKVELAFFAAGSEVAKTYAPKAVASGCVVIDKSAFFRLNPDVPLVVPEVNGELLKLQQSKIFAVPNCTTIPLVMALKPIQDLAGIERVEVATYQAVSGAGRKGVDALQSKELLQGIPIAFNVIPKIDDFLPSGFTKEEIKMQEESEKILNAEFIVNATAVRVPVWQGHSEAVHVQTKKPLNLEILKEKFLHAEGVRYLEAEIPTPLTHAADQPSVFIGRLRRHPRDGETHLNFWLTCDNLYKGAAWNAVQIAESLGFIGTP